MRRTNQLLRSERNENVQHRLRAVLQAMAQVVQRRSSFGINLVTRCNVAGDYFDLAQVVLSQRWIFGRRGHRGPLVIRRAMGHVPVWHVVRSLCRSDCWHLILPQCRAHAAGE